MYLHDLAIDGLYIDMKVCRVNGSSCGDDVEIKSEQATLLSVADPTGV